jgi:PAS domain S-box-containing protein
MVSGERDNLRLRADEFARLLFEEASDGLFVSSAAGVYLDVNRSGHRMLGYEYDELIGKNITDVVLEHDVSHVRAALEAISQGAVQTKIWLMVRKDGSHAQLEVLAQMLSNGTVLAIVRELTSRAEFERKIQASEAKLRSILHTAPDTIMTVDRQGRILFINRARAPYSVEQIVGTSCYDYVPVESRERVRRAIEHVFTTRSIDEYEVEGPPGVDGMRPYVSVRAGPLIEREAVVAATLCATDVTYRKHAEKTRAKLEEQLMQSQKMESVGQLAGGVAHDFNNLLTTVMAFVELTQAEMPASPVVREYLDEILAAAARGAALTQQLLTFARKKIVKPEDTALSDVLNRLSPMVRRVLGEHIEVDVVLAAELDTVRVDVGSLEQVVMNLIVNARDAMPNGGRLVLETSSIELDEQDAANHSDVPPGHYAVLGVTDTGTGMSPEVRARLFEPFFTTKAPGAGTGLGLAMCHGIVKQAGGSIAVYSELGHGTSFRIYLPCTRHSQRPAAAPSRPAVASTGHETLLVVEDEPMILRVARAALEKLGYHVLCAGDGLEALEVAGQVNGRIDLLVTDIVMPKLGGHDLAARLCMLRPDTKVLYTSGYAENAIAYSGVLREGVNFIQKPYSLTALAERVREVLDDPGKSTEGDAT